MTAIYLVTAGDYSDYHVMGVFSTQDNAEAFMDACGDCWNTPRLEIYPLDESVSELEQGLHPFLIYFRQEDGALWEIRPASLPLDNSGKVSVLNKTYHGTPLHLIETWGRDEAHAIKSASDLRRQFLAER